MIALPLPAFTPASCAIIRQLTSSLGLPLVAFSAECRAEAIDAALRAGADDFLPLPMTTEEMVARLAAVIRVRFGSREEMQRSDYHSGRGGAHGGSGRGAAGATDGGGVPALPDALRGAEPPRGAGAAGAVPLPHTDLDGQNALDATVSRLRRKVGADRIVTVRGIGYQLADSRQPPANLSYLHDAPAAREANGRGQ